MSKKQKSCSFAWILSLSVGLICSLEALIQPVNAIEFPATPQRESPRSTSAAGRRTKCLVREYPVIQPLTPTDDNYIKTVSAQPQLFVYLPKTDAQILHFILKDENGQKIGMEEILLTQNSPTTSECYGGYIATIDLAKITQLEVNKKYQWEILLFDQRILTDYYFDTNIREQYPNTRDYIGRLSGNYGDIREKYTNVRNYSQGIFERVSFDSEMRTQLCQKQDVLQQAQTYAKYSIWAETLAKVLTLKQSQPEQWSELLTSVGLNKYIDKKVQ